MGFVTTFITILIAFFLGVGISFAIFGKMALNYMKVRAARGKKMLVFADTPLGRKSYVGKVEGDVRKGTVRFKYNGGEIITEFSKEHVGKYHSVYYLSLNIDNPEVPYKLTNLGEEPEKSVDNRTLKNIINRALTLPSTEEEKMEKQVKMIGIGVLIIIGGLILIYTQIVDIQSMVEGLKVVK